MNLILKSPIAHWIQRFFNSPFAFQVFALGLLLLFLLSFRPVIIIDSPFFLGGSNNQTFDQRVLVKEPGFLINQSQTSSAGRQRVLVLDEDGQETVTFISEKRTETITYKIKSGDTVSSIAHQFGLNVSTLLWSNNLTAKSNIKPDQSLKIPPIDGVFYTVQRGDTLSEIAKRHNTDINKMYTYNQLRSSSVLRFDQQIFIPDAKKIFMPPKVIATQPKRPSNKRATNTTPVANTGSIGYSFTRPTKGVLTQGFHRKHYALDIANKMNTPIYASAAGTVIKSADGWNYGYGKYIVIDHGNDVETLYSHLNERKARVGDTIKTGQMVGLMGNSGNVFGPTGIHLHFEIRIRGRKVNPLNYF